MGGERAGEAERRGECIPFAPKSGWCKRDTRGSIVAAAHGDVAV